MVAAPHQQDQKYYAENARAYLQSLQDGLKPDIRPEFGRFEQIIKTAERVFDETKPPARPGPTVAQALQSMVKTRKYPGLADLLTRKAEPGQTEQGEQEGELGMPALPKYAQLPASLSAGACPELDWYTAFSRKASDRAYDDYHQFCGLWLFSTIAGRRVYLEIKKKKFYTNLMLSLCGTTSFYAKSFTANVAKQLLYELGLGYTLAPNRITPQKLLSDMAGGHVPTNYDDLEDEKQEKIRRRLGSPGQKGLLFDELGLFIQSMLRKQSTNADFADLLMTFDECPPEYENATIARGGEPIVKPYLTLLGCMTPTNLKQNAKAGSDFWQDGFWSRFSFIVAPPPPTADDDPGPPQVSDLDDLDLPYPPALLQSLRAWHERLGVPTSTLEPKLNAKDEPTGSYKISREDLPETACTLGKCVRQAWTNYDYALRHLCLHLGHQDFNGSYVRLAETAMRIAVLLASLSNNNVVELRHWAKAQELTEILRKHLHDLYAQVNAGDLVNTLASTVEERVLAYVEKHQDETDLQKIPTLRNLARYVKGVHSGLLKSVVVDLTRVHLLQEAKRGKATYYRMGTECDDS